MLANTGFFRNDLLTVWAANMGLWRGAFGNSFAVVLLENGEGEDGGKNGGRNPQ